MSATIIEHVVLLQVKPEVDPTQMLASLNALSSLPQVLYLTAGPIFSTKSSPFPFTHLLHSRYSTKDDLSSYNSHPQHHSTVNTHVFPYCDDLMGVDWVNEEVSSPDHPKIPPGEAIRFTLLKLKEGSEGRKGEVLGMIKGIKGRFGDVSCGENFSLDRGRGFSIGSFAVFRGVEEMEKADGQVEEEKMKVREHLESVIVVDYVVPTSQL